MDEVRGDALRGVRVDVCNVPTCCALRGLATAMGASLGPSFWFTSYAARADDGAMWADYAKRHILHWVVKQARLVFDAISK